MQTILIVDDHKNIREYCRDAFSEEGYRVVMVRGGAEAILAFVLENPDLAILDISMPEVGGLEAMEHIKTLSPRTPVILFTSHADDCLRDHRAAGDGVP